jgi:hypothetical protein
MFLNPVLRQQGTDRMVYATSVTFRVVFAVIALAIILSIAAVAEGPFLARLNALSLVLIGLCLFAALSLQRWTFDKTTNRFEKHVGLLFLYSRRRRPLGALQRIVLRGYGVAPRSGRLAWIRASGRTVAMSLVDEDGSAYLLDMTRGGSARQMRKTAERLSEFCGIPLEDGSGIPADETSNPTE